jgi:hypothetical protein
VADILMVGKGFIGSIESPYYPAKYNLNHINTLSWFLEVSPREFLPEKPFDPDIIITI